MKSNEQYMPADPPPYPTGGGAPPPPHVYTQQPQSGAAVTVVHVQGLGPYPMQTTCQACHAQITTTTKPNSGLLTWLIAGGLCLVGCWLGCCLIPFCVDACQDVEHSCPNCKASIGAYRRL